MTKDWTYKKLGEVCKGEASNIALNKISDNIGEYPLYGASGLAKHIDFYKQDVEYIGIVKDGAGVGRVGLYPAKSSLVGTMQYIIPSSEVKLRYLFYVLKGLNLANLVSGATIPHIYFKDYSKITIPVPPISIQESIVRELDAIHGILEKKQEQLRELDNLAQAIFYEMFGDPITNPKQWKVKKLGELTCKCANISWNKVGKYTRYDYVDLTSVNRETYQIEEPQNIDSLSAPSRAKQIIREGDVLFGTTRPTLKRVCVVPKQYDQQICSTGFCVLRPLECVNSQWLFHTLCADNFYEYIEPLQTGANYPAVSDSIVKSYSIPLPPLSLQQSFAAKIEAIEAQKQAVQQSIREVEALLAERMDNYFS